MFGLTLPSSQTYTYQTQQERRNNETSKREGNYTVSSKATDSNTMFEQMVIEVVRMLQCGLSLYDMFSPEYEEQDGLLCDETAEGVQKWITEIGRPYCGLEVSPFHPQL